MPQTEWSQTVLHHSGQHLGDLAGDIVTQVHNLYDSALLSVMLYGSYARGDADAESDVDVLLILQEEGSVRLKRKGLMKIGAELSVKWGVLVSLHAVSAAEYQKWLTIVPYYRNVQAEGVSLYGRRTA